MYQYSSPSVLLFTKISVNMIPFIERKYSSTAFEYSLPYHCQVSHTDDILLNTFFVIAYPALLPTHIFQELLWHDLPLHLTIILLLYDPDALHESIENLKNIYGACSSINILCRYLEVTSSAGLWKSSCRKLFSPYIYRFLYVESLLVTENFKLCSSEQQIQRIFWCKESFVDIYIGKRNWNVWREVHLTDALY